ncbi:MAG: Type prenyl endopeptidase Rce1-like [Thermoplasmata archaeon]|jgi:membrane protease YdiL (CAAX protease family)|nr:Type prenyl endopeptidase Rce1-like [Thermoplasmata archaeon]
MEVQGLLTAVQEHQAAFVLGLAVALAHFAVRRNGWQAAGVGLMTVPAWQTLLAVLPDLALPFVGSPVPFRPLDTQQQSSRYIVPALRVLGPLGAGFLLWARGRDPGLWRHLSARRLAGHLRATGVPLGAGEAPSARLGLAAFPVLALANLALLWLTAGLSNSDESRLDANITLYHVLMISAVAAVGEELLYRGLVQTGLWHALKRIHAGGAMAVAITLQAALFGFAHAGYQNLQHFLFAALFGLLSGVVAWRFGLWAAIMLHFLIDLYAFGLGLDELRPFLGALLLGLAGFTALAVARSARARRVVA